jgi:hypothetical protein
MWREVILVWFIVMIGLGNAIDDKGFLFGDAFPPVKDPVWNLNQGRFLLPDI